MKKASETLSVAIDPKPKRFIVSSAKATNLTQSDVIRQGLKIGVPMLVRRLRRPRRSLTNYLDYLQAFRQAVEI